jgi:uncharacterized protein DUF6220
MALVRLHAAAAWIFVAAIVVQVVLAGLAIAKLGGSGDFSSHIEFGYTWVGLAGLAVVLTALVARRPRRDVGITLGLLGLYIVQTVLPSARGSLPFLAALHPLNAMVLFVLAIWYARRAWASAMPPATVMPAAPAVDR